MADGLRIPINDKKPYKTPSLRIYGDGGMGVPDGGNGATQDRMTRPIRFV